MPTFASKGWYRIRGKGWVAIVYNDVERDRDATDLLGKPVMIDGEIFTCIAVDRRPKGGPLIKGEEIGLLVKEQE